MKNTDVKSTSLRVTTVGAYHLQRFPYVFVYYDAISTDVPILDRGYREKILDVQSINERLERGEILLSYLNLCADQSLPPEAGIDWYKMVSNTRENINFIRKLVESRD